MAREPAGFPEPGASVVFVDTSGREADAADVHSPICIAEPEAYPLKYTVPSAAMGKEKPCSKDDEAEVATVEIFGDAADAARGAIRRRSGSAAMVIGLMGGW